MRQEGWLEMDCPNCGSANKPEAAFCMSCGASLPDTPFAQLKKESAPRPQAPAPQPQVTPQAPPPTPQAPPPPAAPVQPQATAPAAPPAQAAQTVPSPAAPPQAPAPPPEMRSVVEEIIATPQAPPPTPQAPPQAPAPPPEMRSVVEEIIATPQAPLPTPPPPAAPVQPRSAETATRAMEPTPAPSPAAPQPQAPPPPAAPVQPRSAETAVPSPAAPAPPQVPAPPQETPKPVYFIPPEADYVRAVPRTEPVAVEKAPVMAETAPPAPQTLDSTQTIAPVAAPAEQAARERKTVCPECYAPNPEGNSFCQECGSALPVTAGRPAAPRPGAVQPAAQKTATLPAAEQAAEPAYPAHTGERTMARPARGEKAFGVADVLALLALAAGATAIALSYIMDSFAWKKNLLEISMFSHQGAYTPGRTDLLGGPGILPYEGAEFLTVGLIVALALGLVLVFLAVRTGRGPMFILAGCLLLLPAAYMLFQALLPLRQMGIDVDPALGLTGMFFGNEANAGAGMSFWMVTAAGVLLVAAGFIAPPRGWGRLFTFMLCFGAVLGVSFFCAASFNWNLFISEAAAISSQAGTAPRWASALPRPAPF